VSNQILRTRVDNAGEKATHDPWPAAVPAAPETMRAVAFNAFGSPAVLTVREVETPAIGPADVLIRVAATSIGRLLDLSVRAGTHPFAGFRLPHILGAEHAGTVTAVGAGVTSVRVGDRVAVFPVITCGACAACSIDRSEGCTTLQIIGVHRPGAYAEYTAVPASNVQVIEPDVDPVSAAALSLVGPVAMNQLTQAGVAPGDWVLVQGGASALGSLAAALAMHLGARVIATSRSPLKRFKIEKTGVAAALDPTADDFVALVMGLTGGRGVKVAIDDLGHPLIWSRTMDCLATLGTVVTSGAFLGGNVQLDLLRLCLRSQRILGVRTGTRTSAQQFWSVVDDGFRPVIDRTYPLSRAAEAHAYMTDSNIGRVALVVDSTEVLA
jgi:NADPH:quinone reductase-like Zn-dependent oxidoreductase